MPTPPAAIAASSASRVRDRPPSSAATAASRASPMSPGVIPSCARRLAVERSRPPPSAPASSRRPRRPRRAGSRASARSGRSRPRRTPRRRRGRSARIRGGRWTTGRREDPVPGSPAWNGRRHWASCRCPGDLLGGQAQGRQALPCRGVGRGIHALSIGSTTSIVARAPQLHPFPRGGVQNRTNASRSTRGRVVVPSTWTDTWWVAEEDHVFAYTSTRSTRLAPWVSMVFTSRPSRYTLTLPYS